ncbi:MAG: GDSL-type esterase/lipase family protein [Natronincolaceae bacterium]|nr:GDSL-type esterase/lipase family protein [Bacillota bacterium]NLK91476.1 arylesterase [Clostridiales bacterium]
MKLVCMGDSLTFGFKMTRKNSWPQIVGENLKIDVKNKGICGDTTAGMLSRFGREVVEEKPEYVLIMGGSNDLASQLPDAVIYSNLATMVYQAYHYRIHPIIGVPIPIIPSMMGQDFNLAGDPGKINKRIVLLRNWIMYFGHKQQTETIDFFEDFYDLVNKKGREDLYIDGIHPTIEGNKRMAQRVVETIKKHIP